MIGSQYTYRQEIEMAFCLMTDIWVVETRVLEVPLRNGYFRQVEQGFSSFFAKFLPFLMIFQSYEINI